MKSIALFVLFLSACGPDIAPEPAPDAGERSCVTGAFREADGRLIPEPALCFGRDRSVRWECYLDESATRFTCWAR